uniref:Histone H1-delta-like n=1 Tax=Crassostrea virginica TaxID=6565 RepID=A0A8B8DSW4_CRAVI|nr:histone H1-delta-like [Crassostrea virginica]XP_022330634.1 histone H1-delta-like [Crassostrea virginica]
MHILKCLCIAASGKSAIGMQKEEEKHTSRRASSSIFEDVFEVVRAECQQNQRVRVTCLFLSSFNGEEIFPFLESSEVMADTAPVAAPAKKRATKPKAPAAHPKYVDMIRAALESLKERGGSSRQAILKYIMANFKVGNEVNSINAHLKLALKSGVKKGALKQAKGTGASGSFKLGEKPKTEKKPKAKKVSKPKAAKPKKAAAAAKPKKAAGEKKTADKKKKSPKKAAAPKKVKTPKKKAPAKSPKKAAAAKPKKVKTPKKPAAKKTKKSPAKKAVAKK